MHKIGLMSLASGNNSRTLVGTVGLALAWLFFLFVLRNIISNPLQLYAFDGSQYLDFSDDILSGFAFQIRPITEMAFGTIMRTPVYPLLLSFPRLVFSSQLETALVLTHLILLLGTVVVILVFTPNLMARWSILGAFSMATLRMNEYFMTLSTEWSAFCGLIIVLTLVMRALDDPKIDRIFILAALCGLLPLLRPALLFMLLVPTLVLLSVKQRRTGMLAGAAIISAFPVMVWIGINFLRLGVATISPVGGYTLFATASLIGNVKAVDDTDRQFEAFRQQFNSQKQVFTEQEVVAANTIPRTFDMQPKYSHNMGVAWAIGQGLGLDVIGIGQIEQRYAVQAILENLDRYLLQIRTALTSLRFVFPLFLVGLVLPCVMLRNAQGRPFLATSGLCFLIHIIHVSFSAAFFPLDPRFYTLTLAPCIYMSCLTCCQVLISRFRRNSCSSNSIR
ncbi:MAG: hypothetical protein K1X79_10235 [Oligoflexia bacterium]|nr:hypothetical protein [Oligoflexia bacterium]